jgi:hypothetical protein
MVMSLGGSLGYARERRSSSQDQMSMKDDLKADEGYAK